MAKTQSKTQSNPKRFALFLPEQYASSKIATVLVLSLAYFVQASDAA